ncbi:MAG TPA: hypothetical protein VKF37_12615 [Chloroflexota bacterium]|nr:hypothetical protein [Chloroflexota bacterium]
MEERIVAKLGQPTRDPHGDPIPQRDGTRSGAGHGRADRSTARGGTPACGGCTPAGTRRPAFPSETGLPPELQARGRAGCSRWPGPRRG